MRYIFDTHDQEGIIGMQIAKWAEDNKLTLIEKGEPIIELKEKLERVAKALETLKKVGYNSDVMKAYIRTYCRVDKATLDDVLRGQEQFFKQIGVKI